MRRLIVPALGLLILGVAAQTAVSARGDRFVDEAGWFLLPEGEGLKLVYGMPNSDHIGLMLVCVPGNPFVSVYGEIEPELSSLRRVDDGPAPMDPLSQGRAWAMTLSLDDPGLWLLSDRGYLPIRSPHGRGRLETTKPERELARRFLSACAQQHA